MEVFPAPESPVIQIVHPQNSWAEPIACPRFALDT